LAILLEASVVHVRVSHWTIETEQVESVPRSEREDEGSMFVGVPKLIKKIERVVASEEIIPGLVWLKFLQRIDDRPF
jgi:hypothetical protein